MVIMHAVWRLIGLRLDITGFNISAPVFSNCARITPDEATALAHGLIKQEIEQEFPACGYAVGSDPGSCEVLIKALERTDRDYRELVAKTNAKYQQGMQALPLDDLADEDAWKRGQQMTREKDEALEQLPAQRVAELLTQLLQPQ